MVVSAGSFIVLQGLWPGLFVDRSLVQEVFTARELCAIKQVRIRFSPEPASQHFFNGHGKKRRRNRPEVLFPATKIILYIKGLGKFFGLKFRGILRVLVNSGYIRENR
jgi:hypothetical protein